MKDLIEARIISAIRKLLTERVNELLGNCEYTIPIIEFVNNGCGNTVSPMISLSTCERTETARIIATYTVFYISCRT